MPDFCRGYIGSWKGTKKAPDTRISRRQLGGKGTKTMNTKPGLVRGRSHPLGGEFPILLLRSRSCMTGDTMAGEGRRRLCLILRRPVLTNQNLGGKKRGGENARGKSNNGGRDSTPCVVASGTREKVAHIIWDLGSKILPLRPRPRSKRKGRLGGSDRV